ncbi:hypothetical protein CPB83DRAFT_911283 [Crepidotus variabilis]|uniref:DUF6533 domain-containing protein n=1 Tax=Crepidotus variabilis TaxID=179855 RepID=A0A9P6JJ04_9AGAR|nr:hypothetical protein CPB83DRAFT_911283 [Crepidotus variabilis]
MRLAVDGLDLDPAKLGERQVETCFIVSGFTVVVWDILENVPAELRLYQEHPFRFPSIIYFSSRVFTLALFVRLVAISLNQSDSLIYTFHNTAITVDYPLFSPSAKTFIFLVVTQRGFTSLLFYLRVQTFYPSNLWIRGLFILALGGTMISCGLIFRMSGAISGIFDLLVFLAILWRLGRRPGSTHEVTSRFGWPLHSWTFWAPFRHNEVYQISDRLLQDSLLYLLLVIAIKLPQLIYLASSEDRTWHLPIQTSRTWLLDTLCLDIAISSVTSSRISRDMKLGLPGLLKGPTLSIDTSALSNLTFTAPPTQVKTSNEA